MLIESAEPITAKRLIKWISKIIYIESKPLD